MPDSVFDTTVIAFSNDDLANRTPGNQLDTRLSAIEDVVHGRRRIRYNGKLLGEYVPHLRVRRNDVIDLFVGILDSTQAVRVSRNSLSRQLYAKALQCGWPSHDQHLLAAAVDGDRPILFVTEQLHGACSAAVRR